MPADVFRALDDIEYGFMRERVEAEFSSAFRPAHPTPTPRPLLLFPLSFLPRSIFTAVSNSSHRNVYITDSSHKASSRPPLITEFNETQTTKRSAYRKKVAAAKKQPKDSADGDTTMGGTDADGDADADGDVTMGSAAGSASGGGQHRAKKARTSGGADAEDRTAEMEDDEDPPSDAHYESSGDEGSMPEEDDEEDDEDEDEDGEEGPDGEQNGGEEQDELEEREDRPDEDEALDDGNNSD